MSAACLECRNLGFRSRDGVDLVSAVSLKLQPDDRLAIIGPNGAGKSTLLRMLSGLMRPTAGEVWIEGRALGSLSPVERALRMAVVGQTDLPDPRLAVGDYVELGRVPHVGLRARTADQDIVAACLQRTGTSRLRERAIGSLSGGERQRVQLARALAQEPRILFLDEPTNHLDPRARGELLDLVAGLDVAVVAVLHDLSLVTPFATKVALLEAGRLRACGTPRQTLSEGLVREVFAVDIIRLAHPIENRELTVFDIPFRSSR